MNTLEAIRQRRAVKVFDPAHKMSEEEVIELIELAMLSPTSLNMQNWRFVVVTDVELRRQLRAAAFDQAHVEESSITIVLCADLKAWNKNPGRYWRNASKELQELYIPFFSNFYGPSEQLQRDEAIRSIGIAAQTIMLSAKAMGYDSCPLIGYDPRKVAEIIRLPDDHIIGMMITIGKALEPARPRGGQLPINEVMFSNTF